MPAVSDRRNAGARCATLRSGSPFGLALSVWILIADYNQMRTPGVEAQNWIIPGVVGLVVAVRPSPARG